jgi:hypothetical protein
MELLLGLFMACLIIGLVAIVLPVAATLFGAIAWLVLLPVRILFELLILPLKLLGFLILLPLKLIAALFHIALFVAFLPLIALAVIVAVIGAIGGIGLVGLIALTAIGLPIALLVMLLRAGSGATT